MESMRKVPYVVRKWYMMMQARCQDPSNVSWKHENTTTVRVHQMMRPHKTLDHDQRLTESLEGRGRGSLIQRRSKAINGKLRTRRPQEKNERTPNSPAYATLSWAWPLGSGGITTVKLSKRGCLGLWKVGL